MTAGSATAPFRIVLQEGEGARPLSSARRFELLRALLAKGYAVTCTGSHGDPATSGAGHVAGVVVLGESVDGAESGGMACREAPAPFRDITGAGAEAVVALVEAARRERQGPAPGEWKPWFPVIDYGRCTNCMQCLSFCLFDVYGVDAKKNIEVKNPDKCKTNCPACSRVCPEVAILFPKYTSGPINGAEVNQTDVEREKMKIDVSALLGGDIYALLRDRHERAASRFSRERDESKALKERMRCLEKLRGEMDIPPEVLMALPSADEIRAKAARAAEQGERALRERAVSNPSEAPPGDPS